MAWNDCIWPAALGVKLLLFWGALPGIALAQDQTAPSRPGTGGLFVQSNPTGAKVQVDGKPRPGLTPLMVRNLTPGDHLLELSRGPLSRHQTVRIEADRFTRVQVRLLDLRRISGRLEVFSQPPVAKVLLDSKPMGSTPLILKDLETGRHRVELRLEGYLPHHRWIWLESGGSQAMTAILKPAIGLGVGSDPPGASVILDGRPVGRTPTQAQAAAGTHLVRLEFPGYQPEEVTVEVQAGSPAQVYRQLKMTEMLRREVEAYETARRQRHRWSLAGHISVGVAVASLAGAAVLYATGSVQGTDAHTRYTQATTHSAIESGRNDIDHARALLYGGHALLGLSLVAAGSAIFCYLRRPAEQTPPWESGPAIRLSLQPGTPGLALGGKF